MSSFSFNARYALLTYAQCGDLDPFAVSDHFTELGAECIVAREDHADGGTHLHSFVDFGRKYRVDPEPYRPDPQFVFDLTGAPELLDWSHDTLNAVRGVGTVSLLRWLSYPSLTRCDLFADAPAFQGDPPRRGPSTLQPARSRALIKESD